MKAVALHACNPGPMTGEGNWTWLVPGRVPTLIDAGVGDPRHLAALEAALARARLAQVLVTHGHSDHASGAGAIAARMPDAAFLKLPWPGRDERWRVAWTTVADGAAIPAGDTALTVVHTPGHAPDHVCFWHAPSRTLFGGDLVISGTTVFVPPAPGGDLTAYLRSLERVLALDPARILPAHGPVIDDPAPLLRKYLVHRLQREEQVLDALRRGESRIDAMTARVYRGLAADLLPRARDTVTAHLEKLEREGRAVRRGETWLIGGPDGSASGDV